MILAVAGCVAQAEGARDPGPRALRRHRAGAADLSPPAGDGGPRGARRRRGDRHRFPGRGQVRPPAGRRPRRRASRAFLTIQEGCDKFCSFCVVPYTRGAEQSRPAAAILAEARRLVAQGAREITLLGQNVNAWHGAAPDGATWGLGRLIRELADLPGLLRLRYTTSHPRDMDDELIAAHRDVPTLMPFLHLPVQSGSDRMLAAMNRRHTAARLPADRRPAARRAAGPRAVVRLHRRPPRRDRGGFRRPRCAWCATSASPRPTASNTRRAPARRPPARRPGAGGGEGAPPAGTAGAAAGAAGARSTPAASG